MKVVRAEEHHIPDIGRLWGEFMLFHGDIEPWWAPREGSIPGFQERHVGRFMQSENSLVLVALENGKVIGYSLAEVRGPSPGTKQDKWGFIDSLAVTAGYRRKGVGQKMLSEILAWFKLKGVDRIELDVSAKNAVGYSFWRKHGFKDYAHRLYLDRG